MAYTIGQLSDFEDIRTLKHRYFRGIDTADMTLLEPLFTDDVTVDYRGGTYRVRLKGRGNMLNFIANSFHSGAMAMHHGHMPDITLTGESSATGIWYLEDVFINLEERTHTTGSAIYRDVYRREGEAWRIAQTEYDRVIEMIRPLAEDAQITFQYLASVGLKPAERTNIAQLIDMTVA